MSTQNKNQIISIFIADLSGGGAERVMISLANELVVRGYDVDFILAMSGGILKDSLLPEVNLIEFKVSRLINVVFPLMSYINKTKPQALIANVWPLTICAIMARLFYRVSVVVVEHTSWSHSPLGRSVFGRIKIALSMRLFFRYATHLVVVSEGAANDLATFTGIPRSRIQVIHNGVAGNEAAKHSIPTEPKEWLMGTHKKVLAVGSFKVAKDYRNLLEAFALLLPCENAKLLILGDGELRAPLRVLAKELNIQARVFMPGYVVEPEGYFNQADLYVLSSKYEGLPTVLIEALGYGLPIVSTDCESGPREILCGGEYGRLVPVGDSNALAQAMRKSLHEIHDEDKLRLRATDFSVEKMADEYIKTLVQHQAIKQSD